MARRPKKTERRPMTREEVLNLAERMAEGRASPQEVKTLGRALEWIVGELTSHADTLRDAARLVPHARDLEGRVAELEDYLAEVDEELEEIGDELDEIPV